MLTEVVDVELAAVETVPLQQIVPDDFEHPSVVRGVRNAFLLSIPFWGLFGYVLYLLI